MTPEWDNLPLLPLRCVLSHLSLEDALAAMSTCRHWRNAILLYEGHREIMRIRASQMIKTKFLTPIFRRNARSLHVYLDGNAEDIEELMNRVLPQFLYAVKLRELIFIGPSYLQQNHYVPFTKLKRIITECLLFKHIHCIDTFALLGCELGAANNEDKSVHTNVEYYSRDLKFTKNAIMSAVNLTIHDLASSLRHIMVDYSQISTACLQALEPLRQLRHLTLNVTNKSGEWTKLDWRRVQRKFVEPLQVTLNIIAVPYTRFHEIIIKVLGSRLHLVALKVMYCKSLYTPLLSHVSRLYSETLREVVWADSPFESTDPYFRVMGPMHQMQADDYAHVNPFVLLCWQCMGLKRLVIHGYWTWHYDLLGFVRLRRTLASLEISSVYSKQSQFGSEVQMCEDGTVRVMLHDQPCDLDTACVEEVNEYTEFKWKPVPWSSLHPGLRARPTPAERADYLLSEARRPLGVT